jgi:hypothetical protein
LAFTETVVRSSVSNSTSESSFLNRIKEEFLPAWDDHVHTKVVVSGLIAKKKGTMGGRRSLTSVISKLPQSAGIALFEDSDLPIPDTSTAFNPALMARSIYARMRWTGHVERSSKKEAWEEARKSDLRLMRKQSDLNFARMLYLGRRQILGQVLSYEESGDASMTMYGRDARTSVAADCNKYGAHYLRVGQRVSTVATIDAAETNQLSATNSIKISSISTATEPVIGLSGSWSTNPTDTSALVVPHGSRRASITAGAEMDSDFAGIYGLLDLASSYTMNAYLYGIDKSAQPTLAGKVNNNGSDGVRAFDENLINLLSDQINDDGLGDDATDQLMHKATRREYVKAVQGDRRFPEVITKRGFGKLTQQVGDVMLPVSTDRDCMPGVIWLLESEGFGWLSQSDWGGVDEGERFVDGKDAHELVFHKSGNCFTKRPCNNGMLDDISFSTTGLTDAP